MYWYWYVFFFLIQVMFLYLFLAKDMFIQRGKKRKKKLRRRRNPPSLFKMLFKTHFKRKKYSPSGKIIRKKRKSLKKRKKRFKTARFSLRNTYVSYIKKRKRSRIKHKIKKKKRKKLRLLQRRYNLNRRLITQGRGIKYFRFGFLRKLQFYKIIGGSYDKKKYARIFLKEHIKHDIRKSESSPFYRLAALPASKLLYGKKKQYRRRFRRFYPSEQVLNQWKKYYKKRYKKNKKNKKNKK